jgi:YVTN family beta-propeller protein
MLHRGRFGMRKHILLSAVVSLILSSTALAAPFAYVGSYWDGTISVIDTATNTVTAVIPTGRYPYAVAVNPSGTRVYVTKDYYGELAVIDAATNTVLSTVLLPHTNPLGVAVNPDGTRVYVSDFLNSTISVLDTATNTVIGEVLPGSNPYGLTVNPAGTKLYVANNASGTVSVLDTASNAVVNTITVGGSPTDVIMNADGSRLYVSDGCGCPYAVHVIDTATDSPLAGIEAGTFSPLGMAINPTGTRIYLTNLSGETLSVIDTATNALIDTIIVGVNPGSVALNPEGTLLYVVNSGSDDVSVIDAATNAVIDTIAVGSYPHAFGNFVGPATISSPDTTPPTVTVSASPNVLWPPDHRMVKIKIDGSATDDGSGIASVVITVTDEYGVYNMTVPGFGSAIRLKASRKGSDKDGRVYTITAVATNNAGSQSTATTTVIVPHDEKQHHGRRHKHHKKSNHDRDDEDRRSHDHED